MACVIGRGWNLKVINVKVLVPGLKKNYLGFASDSGSGSDSDLKKQFI